MRLLACLLLIPALSSAQVPHTFSNGEVADAEQINQNFNYVLENASGGCTVEQVDNTAEISCADGSTAVIPGYGTVLIFPEGVIGEPPVVDINTGPIVIVDANDVVMGEHDPDPTNAFYRILLGENIGAFPVTYGYIGNDSASQSVQFTGRNHELLFAEPDCTGPIFSNGVFALVNNIRDGGFLVEGPAYTVLFKSRMASPGLCQNGEFPSESHLMKNYTPAPEILNAAYPVRIEQLP